MTLRRSGEERRDMSSRLKILISHAYDEKELAKAWKMLLDAISGQKIEVWFSSDLHAEGGVLPGVDWHNDLEQRLLESDFVLAIQTPSSVARIWIMWECGIAHGIYGWRDAEQQTRRSKKSPLKHGIIPIAFAIERGNLVNPLNMYQVFEGDNADQVRQVCAHLLVEAGITPADYIFDEPLATYFSSIQAFHPRKMVTAQEMNMWHERFERLIKEGKQQTDLISTRQMMYTSLGPTFKPLDLALHDTLSSLLLDQEKYSEALQEIEYALQLTWDDLRLLHRKALALLGLKRYDEAAVALQHIFSLDATLRLNPEIGSLQGRVYREHWQATGDLAMLDAAIQAYLKIYIDDKKQYFPGINAAALLLHTSAPQQAEGIFQEILTTCLPLQARPETSYWVDFTIGEAYLGLDHVQEALAAYQAGTKRDPAPAPRDRDSALGGIKRMAECKKLAKDEVAQLTQILRA